MMYQSMGTVERMYYAKRPHPHNPEQGIDVLVVEITIYGETEELYVPNNAFTLDNPALQIMAYCSTKPSELGNASGSMVPVVTNNQMLTFHESLFHNGKQFLEASKWGPEA